MSKILELSGKYSCSQKFCALIELKRKKVKRSVIINFEILLIISFFGIKV